MGNTKEIFVTAVGTLKYPRLNEADTKFNPSGEYNCRLILSEADAEALVEKLQPLHDEAVAAGRAKYDALPLITKKKKSFTEAPFLSECVDDEGNANGEYELVFKMKASGQDAKTGEAWSRRPALFDADGDAIAKAPQIWGGTEARVSFTVMQYFMSSSCTAGISLKLEAVQIIKLVSGSNSKANGSVFGFGKVSGGYKQKESNGSEFNDPAITGDVDSGDNGYDF